MKATLLIALSLLSGCASLRPVTVPQKAYMTGAVLDMGSTLWATSQPGVQEVGPGLSWANGNPVLLAGAMVTIKTGIYWVLVRIKAPGWAYWILGGFQAAAAANNIVVGSNAGGRR